MTLEKPARRSLTLLALLAAAALAACSTMEGAGRDIKSGGENLEDAARDARDN